MSNEELVERIQHEINTEEYLGQLYIQNKGFIAMVLRKYRFACQGGYNSTPIIEMDELMHEAYFGIVEAAEMYSPDQGANFLTYAEYWISQIVKRFLDNSGRVIRVYIHNRKYINTTRQRPII